MGKSANMFMSSNEDKETLNKRVTLLAEQMDYARSKKKSFARLFKE